MPRELPKVYVNKFDKEIGNNNKVFYSRNSIKKEEVKEEKTNTVESIRKKVISMFNSPNFVYKMDVVITTKDNRVLEKKLIAMVNDTLLTLDEDKISVFDIKDIKEKTT